MIQGLNIKIMKLKDKISLLDQALADQTIYAEDARKAADFAKLRARLAADLDTHETQWLEAHDA